MPDFEKIERVRVEAIEAIIGMPFAVLDSGFVRVVDYMGGDESVVQAARVSYGKGTKKIHEDRGLIRYLTRHSHTTPFEMCEIKFHLRVPMDCWRQWVRHRTASINEYSTRYSVAIDAMQSTRPDGWRKQATSGRQGSEGFLENSDGLKLTEEERGLHQYCRSVYEGRLQLGVAREQARKDLPLSTYTEIYWKINLHNLLHFLELRMSPGAQEEIRSYAECIGEKVVSMWCPLVWEAFKDYRMNKLVLSAGEAEILRALISGGADAAVEVAVSLGLLRWDGGILSKNRERSELESKFVQLGLPIPW